MHTRELVDLAAFVAAQGRALVTATRQVPTTALAQYWTASKCRHDRWNRALRESLPPAAENHRNNSAVAKSSVQTLQGLCEEVLVSEMLTRVWSCIITSFDSAAGVGEAQPVSASVLAGQLEASNRVLALISTRNLWTGSAGAELNSLRRLTERWTDLLLGSLQGVCEIFSFAHDASRAQEFALDFSHSRQSAIRQQAWALLTASLRVAFIPLLTGDPSNADLNFRIAGAIVACFPADLFDSIGVFHSLWMLRLSATTSDTQLMIDQLIAAEATDDRSENPDFRIQKRI